MDNFLLNTSLEQLIRISTLICVLINMYYIKQNQQLLKVNRRSINQLISSVNKARLHKALQLNNFTEISDISVAHNDMEDSENKNGQ